ncbi:MAG: hypothetical protein R2774_16310 [Saprospiraceae bacterium]
MFLLFLVGNSFARTVENAQFHKDIQSGLLNPEVAYDSYMGFADVGLGFAGSLFPTSWIKFGGFFGAGRGSSFAERIFLSEKFGITSRKFGNSAAHAKGTLNEGGGWLKAGWSTGQNAAGEWGYKFRIGIGSNAINPNVANFHVYLPKSFVTNSFANPSIQVKRSLFNLGSKL